MPFFFGKEGRRKMSEIALKEEINIENMIYEVRGKQVMLDKDIAMLFGYETKYLNRQVQRNIERFPENYCFQVSEKEFDTSSSTINYGGRRYRPYVFTEYGITMLAGILRSSTAVEMSLKIVNAFIAMRKYINNNLIEQNYINKLVLKDHERINLLEESFNKLEEKAKYIEHLDLLDQGFDKLFERVKEEVTNNKEAYKTEIKEMQTLIAFITEKSNKIQVQEARNKDLMTQKFAKVHKQARDVRASQQAVNQYYQNMKKLNYIDPQFMDNKK